MNDNPIVPRRLDRNDMIEAAKKLGYSGTGPIIDAPEPAPRELTLMDLEAQQKAQLRRSARAKKKEINTFYSNFGQIRCPISR